MTRRLQAIDRPRREDDLLLPALGGEGRVQITAVAEGDGAGADMTGIVKSFAFSAVPFR